MKPIGINLIGGFGNQLFQYAHARALAEHRGVELRTCPWIGQRIFNISNPTIDGSEEIISGYFQDQASLIYTRKDAKRWFTFRPEIAEKLMRIPAPVNAHHVRRGDYAPLGYVVVSEKAHMDAADSFGFTEGEFISQDEPWRDHAFSIDMAFLPDFHRLMSAKVLFRANSTFSWWAAVLGNARVFSPVVTGLNGGIEHDNVPFVEGNWPRFCDLPFVTDLHLRDE